MTDRLANLHLLLQARSFERWPLKVTFYAEDVWRVWTRWIGQHLELQGCNGLREGIWVGIDDPTVPNSNTNLPTSDPTTPDAPKGIHALEVTHERLKSHLEKSRFLLTAPQTCNLCTTALPSSGASTIVCPSPYCTNTTHLTCLSSHFLANDKTSILPTTGTCPSCGTRLQWQDLVQELSLRMRGEKEMAALFKPARTSKRKGKATGASMSEATMAGAEEQSDEDPPLPVDEDEEEGVWHHLSSSESEAEDVPEPAMFKKAPSFRKPRALIPERATGPEVVVEDSDIDDAEIVV